MHRYRNVNLMCDEQMLGIFFQARGFTNFDASKNKDSIKLGWFIFIIMTQRQRLMHFNASGFLLKIHFTRFTGFA